MGRHKNVNRRVNRAVRKYNAGMANDELWRGRFILQQIQKDCITYTDGGFTMFYRYRLYDKKTGEVAETAWYSEYEIAQGGKLFWWVNDCIVNKFAVWNCDKNDPNHPFNDTTDYRKIRAF